MQAADMLRAAAPPLLLLLQQHPVEVLTFLVLLYITVYRHDLSSNHSYRKKKRRPAAQLPSLRVPTLSPEDLTHGMRVVSLKVSDMSERVRDMYSNPCGYVDSTYSLLQQSLGTPPPPGPGPGPSPAAGPHRSPLERLLLSQDLLLSLYACLDATDISSLSMTCRGFLLMHDPEFIWQQLWMQRYGRRVWRSAALSAVRQARGIRWSPYANWGPPAQGWKLFFMEFEFGWVDWLLAGANSRDLCLLGYRGEVLDVTAFVDLHPGSGETLLDHAGCECSALIEEIGHSSFAHSLMHSFSITAVHPGSAGEAGVGDAQSDSASEDSGAGAEGPRPRPRSQLEVRLGLERAAALRVAESHRLTMYPVPAACGLRHKGKALGHCAPVFGGPDAGDPDDPFLVVSAAAPAPTRGPSPPSHLVRMCPVAVGRGVSQDSFAPQLGSVESGGAAAGGGMWAVVLGVVSATVNAPSSAVGAAFAEWITVRARSGARALPAQQAPVPPRVADDLLGGIRSGQFSCCELASNAMWQRAAGESGTSLPRPGPLSLRSEEAGAGGAEAAPEDAALLEYVFDATAVRPTTAQLFRELPPTVAHLGQPKVFYDPLTQEWTVWWTCCGVSYALEQGCINRECARSARS